eukprot:scaffold134719_cov36-Prasinocladus_malaysianus.AAC.2
MLSELGLLGKENAMVYIGGPAVQPVDKRLLVRQWSLLCSSAKSAILSAIYTYVSLLSFQQLCSSVLITDVGLRFAGCRSRPMRQGSE